MTGLPISGPADGIYEDGEWISWEWINQQIHERDLKENFPHADIAIVQVFEDLVDAAINYYELTGRYLQIWGELGELYAEISYGIKRHSPNTSGSDGRIGNDWVEIKTISPEKDKNTVQVKRAGNFNKLLVIKISSDFKFESKMIDRKTLRKGKGKYARVSWQNAENDKKYV
jgi:hypothetical protein